MIRTVSGNCKRCNAACVTAASTMSFLFRLKLSQYEVTEGGKARGRMLHQLYVMPAFADMKLWPVMITISKQYTVLALNSNVGIL